MPSFNQVLIIGPGLLGASLGMALKERKVSETVKVWARRENALSDCKRADWCDEACSSVEEALLGCDLVVVCTPVDHIERVLQNIIPHNHADALITDVGSVKEAICKVAATCAVSAETNFIGSHPMAGSEKSGMEHATPKLFEGRNCIVTPYPQDSSTKIEKLENFWRALGMKVFRQTPVEHDLTVAHISHLPHFLASSLTEFLSDQPEEWLRLSGKGLIDTTRVAEGDPCLWREIMKSNQENLLRALDGWLDSVNAARMLLKAGEWENLRAYLSRGAELRKKI